MTSSKGLRTLAVLCTVLSVGGHVGAQTGSCGQAQPMQPGSPNQASNNVSELSLAYQAEQPASTIMCAYGYFAAKCGDYATAHKIFDKCIAKGFAGAMVWKGHMLVEGQGVPADDAAAAAMFKRAAESGHEGYAVIGKLHYASALWEGKGVPRDEAAAKHWFEEAAAEGSEDAQTFLKTGYHTGSRDRSGKGVGTPSEQVQGRKLVAPPSVMPTLSSAVQWALAFGLAALVALGAWRKRSDQGQAA